MRPTYKLGNFFIRLGLGLTLIIAAVLSFIASPDVLKSSFESCPLSASSPFSFTVCMTVLGIVALILGILLILGLFTKVVGVITAVISALAFVALVSVYGLTVESAVLLGLIFISLALLFMGDFKFGLDSVIFKKKR